MASKQLESIVATMPPATATKDQFFRNDKMQLNAGDIAIKCTDNEITKIVATATKDIKNELKEIARSMKVTETVVVLKALKNFGFKSINDSMLVDKRTLR